MTFINVILSQPSEFEVTFINVILNQLSLTLIQQSTSGKHVFNYINTALYCKVFNYCIDILKLHII